MANSDAVARPIKTTEFRIIFGSREAERGWRDLSAVKLSALADAWDFLTRTPHAHTALSYPLKGALATLTRDGTVHQRWQLKLNLKAGARIWYYVEGRTVVLERVHTQHPNQTK